MNFQLFLTASTDIVCALDTKHRIHWANPAAEKILTCHVTNKLTKQPITNFIHHDDTKATTQYLQAQISNSKFAEQHQNALILSNRVKTSDKKYLWVDWTVVFDPNTEFFYCIGKDVTQAKSTQAALQALETATNVGVWDLDPETNEVTWSSKVHEIHETDPLTHKPTLETAMAFYPQESLPILNEALEKMAKGEELPFEVQIITASKKRIWVESKMFTETRDGMVVRQFGTFEDITQKRAQQIENDKLNARIELAMKTSSIGIWEFDIETERLTWDDQMHSIYELSKEDFSHSFDDWSNLVFSEDKDEANKSFEEALQQISIFANNFRINTPTGKIKYIRAIGKVTGDKQGNAKYITGINWDVTDEEKARISLQVAKEQAEAADIAKTNFVANMSHEVRTPLNGIVGALQLLQNPQNNTDPKALIDIALKSTSGLISIINNVLDFSKIQANHLILETTPVNIEALVNEVVTEQSFCIGDKPLTCSVKVTPESQGLWFADSVRLKQIVNNLVNNAHKFTQEGEITVELFIKNQNVCLRVADTGIGMNAEQLEKLFTPFAQADETISRKYGGSGLGLSISKQLIDLFDGSIDVTSKLGKGTSFVVSLPLTRASKNALGKTVSIAKRLPLINDKVIYIAEDNEINQTLIAQMLAPTNAILLVFNDGKTLLEGLQRKTPDLILCDIMMPVMDGISACKAIRETNSTVPIVAFTASVLEEDIAKYFAHGFNDVLAKPVVIDELRKVITRHLVEVD